MFILFFMKAAFFPSEPIQIRSAIRVDVVAMPDKQKAPAPAAKAPAPKVELPKPEIKKPEVQKPEPPKKIDLKAAKKDQQKAIDRLKALQAIENLKAESEEKQKQEEPKEVKGNIASEGSSLTGLEKIEFDRYFGEVEAKVRENWNLPRWLADGNFKAQVLVLIDERGFVTKSQILRSSGNDVFDTLVRETIARSSPFPVPPNRLKNVLSLQGIVFNFPD